MTTYAYRGLAFGRDTDYPLALPMIPGLEGFASRVGDREVPRGHGSVPGKHYTTGRPMTVPFVVARDTRDLLESAIAELREVFVPAEDDSDPLTFVADGQPERLVYCRPTAFERGDTRLGRQAAPVVSLVAADPRIYSVAERMVSVGLFSAGGGGLNYPLDYPKNFAAGAAIEGVATNAGAADAHPVIRFYAIVGTATSVALTNITTGDSVTITTPITPGQVLTVDLQALAVRSGEQIVGLDGVSRYGSWQHPRSGLTIPPGDSVLRFTAVGATDAIAVVTYRDTWLS